MRFSWDGEKARRNLAKHGVSFEQAALVFDDPHALILEDREDAFGETRYHAIGYAHHRLLLVVFVDRSDLDEDHIHIISARKAVDYEKKTYARQFSQGD